MSPWILNSVLISILIQTARKQLKSTYLTNSCQVTYIGPILVYSSIVWTPYTINVVLISLRQFKGGQPDSYVMDDYRYNSSVSSMIQSLKWNSLSIRRNISRLIIFYKILHQTIDISLPDYISPLPYSTITRRLNLRLKAPLSRIDVYTWFFLSWNGEMICCECIKCRHLQQALAYILYGHVNLIILLCYYILMIIYYIYIYIYID